MNPLAQHPPQPPSPPQRGVALIMALLLLSLLTVMVSQVVFSATVDAGLARNARDDLKLQFAARSGITIATTWLRDDLQREGGAQIDSLREPWAREADASPTLVGDVEIKLTLEDAERRLPINQLADPRSKPVIARTLGALCTRLGIPDPEEVAGRITDYIDTDKEGDYEDGARNGPIADASALFEIPDLDPRALLGGTDDDGQEFDGLLGYLTTWGAGQVNVNTCPDDLFWALLPPNDSTGQPIDRDAALEAFIRYRTGTGPGEPAPDPVPGAPPPGQDFRQVDALRQLPGLANLFPAPRGNGNGTNSGDTGGANGTGDSANAERPRALQELLTVKSVDFLVTIEARKAAGTGGLTRRYDAVLRRLGDELYTLLWRERAQ